MQVLLCYSTTICSINNKTYVIVRKIKKEILTLDLDLSSILMPLSDISRTVQRGGWHKVSPCSEILRMAWHKTMLPL